MKQLYVTLVSIFLTVSLFGQSPEKMSYQAVIRDTDNNILSYQEVGIKVSILQGDVSGTTIYSELFDSNHFTNENGLVTLEIGNGMPTQGVFSNIDWSIAQYFIKTEIDPTGGTNYTITSISQLLSVPYALHAKTAETITGNLNETDPIYSNWNKSYNDLTNTPHIVDSVIAVLDTTTLFVRNEIDSDITNEIQSLTVSTIGDTLYLSSSNFVIIPGISEANSINTDTIITFDTYPSNASTWFGGDNRAISNPRNAPYGQSLEFPFNLNVDTFAVYFTSRFDYFENPDGYGHAVDIKLHVRESNGDIIDTKTFTIPSTFNGGWYSFDLTNLNILLASNTRYIFTLYIVDAITNHFQNGVRMDANNSYLDGEQYRVINGNNATDPYIDDFGNWNITSYPDQHFRISGSRIE